MVQTCHSDHNVDQHLSLCLLSHPIIARFCVLIAILCILFVVTAVVAAMALAMARAMVGSGRAHYLLFVVLEIRHLARVGNTFPRANRAKCLLKTWPLLEFCFAALVPVAVQSHTIRVMSSGETKFQFGQVWYRT